MNLGNQNGMVSFLVVMFISVLLVLITASYARVMTRELRQSTDSELSSKAYYAAESAIEESLLDIRSNLNDPSKSLSDLNQDNCDREEYNQFDTPTGYSCRLVSVAPNELTGSLEPDNSRQFNLEGISHNRIKLEWYQHGEDYMDNTGDFPDVPDSNDHPSPNYTSPTNWPPETPPIMRMEIISYPENGPFETDEIRQKVLFMHPEDSQFKNSTAAYNPISPGSNSTKDVKCKKAVNNGDYACELTITGINVGGGPNNISHVVRIKPFYTGTNYRLTALTGTNKVEIPGNTIIIDATGYANDVYRRLQARVPLHSVGTFGQDYVLLADEQVCKRMRVSRPPVVPNPEADHNTGCPPDTS